MSLPRERSDVGTCAPIWGRKLEANLAELENETARLLRTGNLNKRDLKIHHPTQVNDPIEISHPIKISSQKA